VSGCRATVWQASLDSINIAVEALDLPVSASNSIIGPECVSWWNPG
jgi:hypothetical protein